VAERAEANGLCAREDDYAIDGNRYVEAGGSTNQYEHTTRESGAGQGGSDQSSDTIRVLEPFHHLHPVFGRLIDDERIVVPMPGLGDGSRLGPLFTNPAAFDETDQVPAVVPAGSLVFFSPGRRSASQSRSIVLPHSADP